MDILKPTRNDNDMGSMALSNNRNVDPLIFDREKKSRFNKANNKINCKKE